jgi:hypothetical protein
MCKITASLLAFAILAACTAEIKGPEAEIAPPKFVIRAETASTADFCPPGQAKKGNCSETHFCPPGQAKKGRC